MNGTVAMVVHGLFRLCYLILLVRVVLSFLLTPSYRSRWLPFWTLIYGATEPVLAPVRRILAPYQRGVPLDFSVMVVWLLLVAAEMLIIRLIG